MKVNYFCNIFIKHAATSSAICNGWTQIEIHTERKLRQQIAHCIKSKANENTSCVHRHLNRDPKTMKHFRMGIPLLTP